jgi:hypothetical protein
MNSTTYRTIAVLSILDSILMILVVLRLTDVIQWSWIWVLSPFWIIILLILLSFIVKGVYKKLKGKNNLN